jgi:hypothetical protein
MPNHEEEEEDLNLVSACRWEGDILNPPEMSEADSGPRFDPHGTNMTSLVARTAFKDNFQAKDRKNNIYHGVCLRVDENINGYYEVKVRIPEVDGCKPEPLECVPKSVPSNSHYTTEMHTTFCGKLPTAPQIGQVLEVKTPGNTPGSSTQNGQCLALTDEYAIMGRSGTARPKNGRSFPSPPSTGQLQAPPGDDIGSGVLDQAQQVFDAVGDFFGLGGPDTTEF